MISIEEGLWVEVVELSGAVKSPRASLNLDAGLNNELLQELARQGEGIT